MLRRGALIGVMVGILGITAALAVGYPAGAKPAKGHHALCASKAKSAKRHAKCKKARKISRRPASNGSRTVARTPGIGTSTGNGTTTGTAGGRTTSARDTGAGNGGGIPTGTTGTGAVTGTGTATGTAGATTTSTGTTETTGTGTTGARPVVEGESASHLTPTDAVLEGAIDDQGLEASYEFHLVTAPPCLTAKPPCEIAQRLFSTPAGKLLGSPLGQDVSVDLNTAGITLSPGARYEYWLSATSSAGTTDGPQLVLVAPTG